MPDYVGQQLGSYQLIQMLGQGHWGSVYLGEHMHLRTLAAIKLLHGPWDESEVESFLGEARILGRAMTLEQALAAQDPVPTTKPPAPARAPAAPRPAYPDELTERE